MTRKKREMLIAKQKEGSSSLRIWLGVIIAVLICAAACYALLPDRESPRIVLKPGKKYLNDESVLQVSIRDPGAGLEKIRVSAFQDGAKRSLVNQDLKGILEQMTAQNGTKWSIFNQGLPDRAKRWNTTIPVSEMDLQEGEFRIRVRARDGSWVNLLGGNRASAKRTYVLDSTAPRVRLESFRNNLSRGGSGAVAFRVKGKARRVGVSVGDTFFPAYRQDSGLHLALYAYPYDIAAGEESPVVLARDRAGNTSSVTLRCFVNPRDFSREKIDLNSAFLRKTLSTFRKTYPEIEDRVSLFTAVNERVRQRISARLQKIGRNTVPHPLWSEAFLRQPASARQSSFAVKRSYYHDSRKISRATHLGIDLASTPRAKVPAANTGRVVYADEMGIYGKTVILDHGLGLQSLYGHLSRIRVEKGHRVNKGTILGRTGSTGLAGGDHLHFQMMISGIPVDPVEWWDKDWIRLHIRPKLRQAGLSAKN